MAFEITIPRLGWSMEEGIFVRWLKRDGDVVTPGEALFELEGEKAAQDVEAVDGGILRIPPTAPQPNTTVAVGAVIGYLVATGEATPGSSTGTVTAASNVSAVTPVAKASSLVEPATESAAPPSVRRMARERGINLSQVAGSGPAGRILASDLVTANPVARQQTSRSNVASPRARRIARELGVDWKAVDGSGRNGRVRERDILVAAKRPKTTSSASTNVSSSGASIPITRHRRTIADRMTYSRQQTAPVTLTTRIDATNLVSLRQQFKAAGGDVVPSYSDVAIKLAAMVLAQQPQMMAQWGENQLVIPEEISIGLAVDTDAGLLVPVIRNVPSLTVTEVCSRTSDLIRLTRAGQLKANDMQGGVFTITNLGGFGIDGFTPIINSPEAAILGMGRIRREPAVVDNQIIPRDQMTLSLTFDHRIIDGAPAARFLQTISQALESPSAWLLR
ncbi:MAG: dihydrolipoamide acetyltransferase family protein [Planctomycetota bacterium]